MAGKRFGQLCVRCQVHQTCEDVDGLATCDNCQRVMLSVQHMKRPCPVCEGEMSKIAVLNVVVDQCLQCGGAWLGAGKLQKIAKGTRSRGRDFGIGMAYAVCAD